MFLPKIREIKEALTSFFTRPYTTKFPAVSYTAGEEYRGIPKYNDQYCVGCGTCAQVCPPGAIDISYDKANKKKILKINYFSCINCGQCEEHCITGKGIKLSSKSAPALMDKRSTQAFEIIEKEVVSCEVCGEIIAPADHLKWVRERLGAKAYAHPGFLLETQKQFFKTEEYKVKSRIRREDQIKEACPKCRHKIVVEDEFYTVH